MFDSFLNSILGFLLNWQPIYAVIFISFVISVIIVFVYKWMTNQNEMKRLKEDLNSFQKKMKEAKDNPEKLMQLQKEAMSTNMTYMGKSMKPTFITFIPILLIFGWMSAHFAFEPLMPGQEFTLIATMVKDVEGNVSITVPEGLEVVGDLTQKITESTATFKLKGTGEGEHYVTLASGDQKVDKKVIITSARNYAPVDETYKNSVFKSATLGNKQLKVFWKLSWIWAYILSAIVFSMALRKLLKVY